MRRRRRRLDEQAAQIDQLAEAVRERDELVETLREELVAAAELTDDRVEALRAELLDTTDTDRYILRGIVRRRRSTPYASGPHLAEIEIETPSGQLYIVRQTTNGGEPATGRTVVVTIEPKPLAEHDPRGDE